MVTNGCKKKNSNGIAKTDFKNQVKSLRYSNLWLAVTSCTTTFKPVLSCFPTLPAFEADVPTGIALSHHVH